MCFPDGWHEMNPFLTTAHAAHMSVVRARLNISKSHLFIALDSFRRELQSFRGFFEEELRAY